MVRKTKKPSEYVESSSHKKRKKLIEEKKIVTKNRGFWLKFAEQQKRKESESIARTDKIENSKSPDSAVLEKLYCTREMTSNPCIFVHSESSKFPEHSTIPGNTGLELKVKGNNTLGTQPKLNGEKLERRP